MPRKFLTLKGACEWASAYVGRQVSESNISYLIQYGKIRRYDEDGSPKRGLEGITKVSLRELKKYYDQSRREQLWKERLGKDINWNLSFDNITESERTRHVHRLHQYKGKFIPQLVQYFLDDHVNNYKRDIYFRGGGILLDPFAGSGTTLVECMELGIHSIGIDISQFNCMISEVKTQKYDFSRLHDDLQKAAKATTEFTKSRFPHDPKSGTTKQICSDINKKYYPNPDFKILVGMIQDYQDKIQAEIHRSSKKQSKNSRNVVAQVLKRKVSQTLRVEKEVSEFVRSRSLHIEFKIAPANVGNLVNDFTIRCAEIVLKELEQSVRPAVLRVQTTLNERHATEPFADSLFISAWFTPRQRAEMQSYLEQIGREDDPKIQNLMKIILSRTVRSCRATKHVDLATLVEPQVEPYYCPKHFRICRPVNSIIGHLKRYTEDTIERLCEFSNLRKDVFCEVLNADSRSIDLLSAVKETNEGFHKILSERGIDGIFTSPPYVGQIDYHEQHAYAYELFGIDRRDYLEIGRKSDGTGKKAQAKYVEDISKVFLNMEKYLKKNPHIFVVANDSRNLYPTIAERSNLGIIEVFHRPVLNRTERDKQPYSESIFHMVPE